jgi:hypothetical protein
VGFLGQASLPATTYNFSCPEVWLGGRVPFDATGEHTSGVEARPARNGDCQVWSRKKFDNGVNHVNLNHNMENDNEKPVSLIDVGQKLVGHSKAAEFTANRGLVVELFPFIFEASERMSARAISRFLLEEQNIKLSAVTITKALNEPKKSWISFFESIEASAKIIAKWFRPASFKFLFLSKSDYENRTSPDRKEGLITGAIMRGAVALLRPDLVAANKFLREKWFTIGLGTRLKAKPYLEEHLMTLEDKF